mgnify:CR=1 FL=1
MKRSTDRILTTHAGSLPRPDDLVRMMWNRLDGKPVDDARLASRVKEAVAEVVDKQRQTGIDIISDGEMSKTGFSNYVAQRYSGFGEPAKFVAADLAEIPSIAQQARGAQAQQRVVLPTLRGPMELRDPGAVQRDIEHFKAALGGKSRDEAFICAITPGHITFNFPNHYYPSHEAYLEAAGNALRYEYKAIVDAGFNLQLDSPDLAMAGHCLTEGSDLKDHQSHIRVAIEVLNHALADLPPDKLRLHVCWGNYAGPHHKDVELKEIIEPILKTRATFIYFEAANPRHEHEWEVWQRVKLPDGKALIPGVIDTATNHVEHPRLVAQRIERFANIVGKENVIAGTDCGFSTFVGRSNCYPEVAWLKLEALVEGAKIASRELW